MFKNIFLTVTLLASASFTEADNITTSFFKNLNEGNFKIEESRLNELRADSKYQHLADSLLVILNRIRTDFKISDETGTKDFLTKYPEFSQADIDKFKNLKYIETMNIDGHEMWFNKALKNFKLINPSLNSNNKDAKLEAKYDSITTLYKSLTRDSKNCVNWNTITIKFTLNLKHGIVPKGEAIKAWLPIPLTSNRRQRNFKIISASTKPIISTKSAHHTAMMTQTSTGEDMTFEIIYSYDAASQYFSQDELTAKIRPYNKKSADYIKYTSPDNKHIIIDNHIRQLADSIVGEETNPVKQAYKIFNWIGKNYPWAGARDYCTIQNIPYYVLQNNHGDCGQVSLLYISLVRALGIPARWESGWMLHPWDINYHDWAETYFEGIGWVPIDVSFSRITNQQTSDYYATGTDLYHLAINSDYSEPFAPAKKHIRTDPVDLQAGEIEWAGGNVESKDYKSKLTVLKIKSK